MEAVAEARGVVLRHSLEGHVSFTSSPYTPHLRWAAVDLSASTQFGSEAPSPVAGIVEEVLKVDCGPGPYSRVDYLVSIRVEGSSARVKVMHLEPSVKPGERVQEGSTLGRYLRSNYFSYHHVPHLHVEVCRDRSLRPTRALRLTPTIPPPNPPANSELEVRVEEVEDGFALCSLVKPAHELGVVASIGSSRRPALLNGQVGVRAEYLGLLVDGDVKVGEEVVVAGRAVAFVKACWGRRAIALSRRRASFKSWREVVQRAYVSKSMAPQPMIEVGVEGGAVDPPVRGLELMLSKTRPVKLVPWPGRTWSRGLEGARVKLFLKLRRAPPQPS